MCSQLFSELQWALFRLTCSLFTLPIIINCPYILAIFQLQILAFKVMSCIFCPLWVPMGILVGVQGLFTWCHSTPKTGIFAYLTIDPVAERLLFSFENKYQRKEELAEKASKKCKRNLNLKSGSRHNYLRIIRAWSENVNVGSTGGKDTCEITWKMFVQQSINISNQNKLLSNLIHSVQNPCPIPSKFCLPVVIKKIKCV